MTQQQIDHEYQDALRAYLEDNGNGVDDEVLKHAHSAGWESGFFQGELHGLERGKPVPPYTAADARRIMDECPKDPEPGASDEQWQEWVEKSVHWFADQLNRAFLKGQNAGPSPEAPAPESQI